MTLDGKSISWFLVTYVSIGWLIRAAMVPTVLRRQFAPGATWAWLGIVFLHPYIGGLLYMLVGETRLGPHRVDQYRQLITTTRGSASKSNGDDTPSVDEGYQPMVLQAQKISGMPVLKGNSVELLGDAVEMVNRLVADIDAAQSQVHLLYYIIANDSTGQRVVDAVCKAAGRGVKCRVLADGVAARKFLHRTGLSQTLRDHGVEVAAALPAEIFRRRLPRVDLRNHRKLAVIDGKIGYAGSHNLINADYGGRHGGPWYDVTGRFIGPVVDELAIVFHEDWAFENKLDFAGPTAYDHNRVEGKTLMQVGPTGPSSPGATYRRLLLGAIQSARRQLILTTPYFVPDEPTLVSLMMAADRGVDVRLLLPKVPDHFFTAAAGRAHFSRLMETGISIYLYRPGLLHAKTTTVDNAFCLVGSANLDVRSFNLNFELTVMMYGPEVTAQLRAMQLDYQNNSDKIDPAEWAKRGRIKTYTDGAISLLSPLL